MKFFLLLGGFIGFVLAYSASWNAGNTPAQSLTTAAIGCLVGAVLLRGLHTIFFITVRNHIIREASRTTAAAANPGAPV
jgi:hypothetical protein